jgi:toxin ParE1/3/4
LAARYWRVRLSEPAERDFIGIVQWTVENFGRRQALVYRRTLIAALTSLHNGPNLPESAARDEIQTGLRSLHVARQGRRGRHFVLYRSDEVGTVGIVRILHDAMDLARYLPTDLPAPDS